MVSCLPSLASSRLVKPHAAPALSHQHQSSGITRRRRPSTSAIADVTARVLRAISLPSHHTGQHPLILVPSRVRHLASSPQARIRLKLSKSPTLACRPAGPFLKLPSQAGGLLAGAGAVPLVKQAPHQALLLGSWVQGQQQCLKGLELVGASWVHSEAGDGLGQGRDLVQDQYLVHRALGPALRNTRQQWVVQPS